LCSKTLDLHVVRLRQASFRMGPVLSDTTTLRVEALLSCARNRPRGRWRHVIQPRERLPKSPELSNLCLLNLLQGENIEKGCRKKCVSPTVAGRASLVLKDPRSACCASSPSELSKKRRACGHGYPQGRSPPQLRPEPPTRAMAP